MLSIHQIIEGEIESIAFGGAGVLRYRGFVVFIPFTAIGDHISCRILEVRRSFAKGILLELKRSSKNRILPRCPYFGTCGGCQLQHLNQEAQLRYKQNAVHDALNRIGHLSLPHFDILAAAENWAYRRHITLHLRSCDDGLEAGYIGYDNRSFVTVQQCPIFTEAKDPIIPWLQRLIKKLPTAGSKEIRATLLKNQRNQYILFLQFNADLDFKPKIFQDTLQTSPEVAGILIQTPKQKMEFGEIYCEQQLEGLAFRYSPETFVQVHPEQSARIYREVGRLALMCGKGPILDLYCGFGITSLLLAKQGQSVTGIEANPHAILFAKENAALNQLKHVNFLQGNVEAILPKWLKTHAASLVIVNPPRQGLAKTVIERLLKLRAQAIIYVSCMPATLARDLQILSEYYQVKEGKIYDMFPQTAHVETLVWLQLG